MATSPQETRGEERLLDFPNFLQAITNSRFRMIYGWRGYGCYDGKDEKKQEKTSGVTLRNCVLKEEL